MRNKAKLLHPVFVLLVGFTLIVSSCKKEPAKTSPWLSSNFAGSFSGNEVCLLSGTQANSITITATGPTQISIVNLYGSGKSFTGMVSNDTCIIQPQLYNTGSGNAIMQGSFVLRSDSLTLDMIVTTFGQEDRCNALLLKQ